MYILFFLLWIMFNGQFTLEIAVFGLVIAAVMYLFICKFMGYGYRKDLIIVKEIGFIIQYLGLLLWEIVKANMATIRFIMARKHKNEPILVHFKTALKTRTAKTLLANSITLTPGTITVSLEGDEYVVHCLDKSFSEGLSDSSFVNLLTRMEEVALKEFAKQSGKTTGQDSGKGKGASAE